MKHTPQAVQFMLIPSARLERYLFVCLLFALRLTRALVRIRRHIKRFSKLNIRLAQAETVILSHIRGVLKELKPQSKCTNSDCLQSFSEQFLRRRSDFFFLPLSSFGGMLSPSAAHIW